MKTMPNKTDRNDARALAQIIRTGWYREVHVKSRECRAWRSLLVARRTVLNEMRSIENVVRDPPGGWHQARHAVPNHLC
jgi:transposase